MLGVGAAASQTVTNSATGSAAFTSTARTPVCGAMESMTVGTTIIFPTLNASSRAYGAVYDWADGQLTPVGWGINPSELKDCNDFEISDPTIKSAARNIAPSFIEAPGFRLHF